MFNITNLSTTIASCPDCDAYVSTAKVTMTFISIVIVQVVRAYMHYRAIRRYDKGKIGKETFLNNQYLMGILDIVSYPLIIFLLFVFLGGF